MPDSGGAARMLTARSEVIALLALALVLGAGLRFYHLGRGDLSADEGASWAGASLPAVGQVVVMEQQLDPGKLPLYDVLLHGWIRVFGDGVFAMRAMSAGLGTIAIVLMFVAVREVCDSLAEEPGGAISELTGAFAALIYGVNFTMVTSDRTLRMYPLLMSMELLQIFFLVRAQRRGGWSNYAGTAIFTALMVATNFTSCFLLLAEGLWFAGLLAAKSLGARAGGLAVFRPGAALVAGLMLLAPLLPAALASSHQAVAMGALDWIKMGPASWPYAVLRRAVGNHMLFRIFVALGAFGVWRQWRSARLASVFLTAWMMGPILGVLAVSHLIRPLEFPRYVLASFAGLFGLAAFGAASARSAAVRVALAVLFIGLSLGPAREAIKHPHEAAWREATALAARQAAPDEQIAVFPGYCKNVVRYYISPERRRAVQGEDTCGPPRVLILSGRGLQGEDQIAAMEKCYPGLVTQMLRVEVRTR
jgi:mannosyltransferase